ncbi:MAG TPA: lysylphosphatidylglycerol synthase transmembrane domain-containing protein [Solirubrobacteraceae bacterium]|jgi:uncharacterized membrane protein YbhN (UPF0104 family)|nr:lysylphosphatidylglycerol synthase transmembrane domain-containing protein [Solirubrobacteraceae bacterium]
MPGIGAPEDHRPQEARGDDNTGALAAQSRTLRNSIISLSIFFALVVALLLGVPGLRAAADHISDANLLWVLAGIGLELVSIAGYVVLFELVFEMLERPLALRLALSELAVNSAVSLSGLGGLALGAWVLRTRGVSLSQIARRSVLIFVLTSAVNVGAVVLIGVPMWLGLLPGSTNPRLTLLPAGAALVTVIGTLGLASWARRVASANRLEHGRLAVALRALSEGVYDAVRLIGEHDWRLLGAVAYWLADNLVLYACLAAFGHPPSFWVVGMAYLVGMLANSLPIPGGFFAVEGGLVGMLLLFGARPATQLIAAVVIYRAISLWIPALIGSLAFLRMRREIGQPAQSSVSA